ncbi:radial spoke head protein 6 A [Elysia marginata]|uniref:Radial spoke head protein 6 A n=1 Tax=Elysia marginata TaxID=1093978 RepID=A0AAV4IHK0_9GAST|nr:radial spoke head protein 6 A [Elysia marginata]
MESIHSFWGKILGLYKDYFIVETEFQDGDYESGAGSDDEANAQEDRENRKTNCASKNSDTLSKHATFPPFPGNETNYLRAQIARITSCTSVSPIGYFKFDEEGEEEEEQEETRDTYVKDEDFDGVSARDLSDPSLTSWVHHANYILPQVLYMTVGSFLESLGLTTIII